MGQSFDGALFLIGKSEIRSERMKFSSYHDSKEKINPYWEKAHEKNPNHFKYARGIIFAPDESDLHEITLFCIRVLDHNGAWDFEVAHENQKNIITFKYNGTITACEAVSKINFHCDHSIKWEWN